jgi:hypothetical protein
MDSSGSGMIIINVGDGNCQIYPLNFQKAFSLIFAVGLDKDRQGSLRLRARVRPSTPPP